MLGIIFERAQVLGMAWGGICRNNQNYNMRIIVIRTHEKNS